MFAGFRKRHDGHAVRLVCGRRTCYRPMARVRSLPCQRKFSELALTNRISRCFRLHCLSVSSRLVTLGQVLTVSISLVLFMCESPRWLVKRDQIEDARQVLATLADKPSESDEISEEVAMIRFTIADELRNNDSSSPFATTHNRHLHRTLLAMGVNFLAQMSGISVITFYSTTIIEEDLGYSASTARIFAACIQCWQFISAGVAVLLIDRIGRRRMLIGTAIGMCIAQFCLAGLSSDIANKNAGAASIFFFFFAETFFPQVRCLPGP